MIITVIAIRQPGHRDEELRNPRRRPSRTSGAVPPAAPLPVALGGKPAPRLMLSHQLERIHPAYFTNHHHIAKAIDVVAIEIATEVAIIFAHSQCDTHANSSRLITAAH